MKVLVFPDGSRLSSIAAQMWVASSNIISVAIASTFSTACLAYTASNASVAQLILKKIDDWIISGPDGITYLVDTLGTTIDSISPNSVAHGSSTTITITGQKLTSTMQVTISSIVFPITFGSSTSVTIAYNNNLAAGVYDVTINDTAQPSSRFTFVQALTLT